jgi:hypothetical protein
MPSNRPQITAILMDNWVDRGKKSYPTSTWSTWSTWSRPPQITAAVLSHFQAEKTSHTGIGLLRCKALAESRITEGNIIRRRSCGSRRNLAIRPEGGVVECSERLLFIAPNTWRRKQSAALKPSISGSSGAPRHRSEPRFSPKFTRHLRLKRND